MPRQPSWATLLKKTMKSKTVIGQDWIKAPVIKLVYSLGKYRPSSGHLETAQQIKLRCSFSPQVLEENKLLHNNIYSGRFNL